ncbi:BamA/TamA family outer membrane protein [Sorangium cellulosum]|uniref:BamA/TamA family outer membrane protein n=1 Tax=Sorangium cellulosum TaxID=56 RepID=UPI000CF3AAC6|nr:BamA/TamA family outer membrane protein [Sorangium cellulosum]
MGTNEKGSRRALGTFFRRRAAWLAGCSLLLSADALAAPQPAAGAPGAAPRAPRPPAVDTPAPAAAPSAAPAAAVPQAAAPSPAAAPPVAAPAPARPPAAASRDQPPSPRRPLPDYDGRAEAPKTAGDALLWVPRVVFFPAYVVHEYVLRRPLGYLTIKAERGEWIQDLKDIFTFGENNGIGVIPTALFDFGFRASVGVYFFYDDFLFRGNELRVHGATGGVDWLRLTVADRIPVDERAHVKLRAEAGTRPDWLFSGIGPRSLDRDSARYGARNLEAGATFHADFGTFSFVESYTGVKDVVFDDICCEPTVSWRVANGRYPLPPSFDTGYTAYRLGGRLALDSRRPRPAPGHGVRLEVFGEHASDLKRPLESRWARYGGSLGGFVDVTGHDRIVSLTLTAAFADPLGAAEVPFTELAVLGGDAPLRGFREGRLHGRSAAAATLAYRWPIWAFLDGTTQVAVGNVFGEHLRDVELDLMRLSFVVGFRASSSRDHSFDLLVGSATETFEQGAGLEELRLMIGASRGF